MTPDLISLALSSIEAHEGPVVPLKTPKAYKFKLESFCQAIRRRGYRVTRQGRDIWVRKDVNKQG